MANSTSNVDQILSSQAQKEVTVNALLDAMSQALLYGRRAAATTGLTWAYYGGNFNRGHAGIVAIGNGTLALAASMLNYVMADMLTGAVTSNTTGFTAGKLQLYTVLTGATTISSYTDLRQGSSQSWENVLVSVSTTASIAVATEVELCDATAAPFTVTLPQAFQGKMKKCVKKIEGSGNVVTVAAAGADTIDGAATYPIAAGWGYAWFQSDGVSKWYVIG